MSRLFTPLTIKDIRFRNRIAISPMCQYSAVDGYANNWHLVHIGARAVGGAGLIIQEATAVRPEGRITPGCLGLYQDDQIPALKNIVDFIKEQGAVAGIQLAHAGRKASCDLPWKGGHQLSLEAGGWETVAPSALPFHETDRAPHELNKNEIQDIISSFVAAAARALEAGYQLIEIHGAHGYLINEFLSPLTNHRRDEYGGSFENRIRFLLEIIAGVQSVWPANLPVFLRISATDWAEGGWTIDDSVALARIVKDKGIDLVDCSSGGNVPHVKIPVGPGYQIPLAEAVKKGSGIPTGAVGLINQAAEAEAILEKGQADLVLIARASLRDPHFPLHAAKALGDDIEWPVQYLRAK